MSLEDFASSPPEPWTNQSIVDRVASRHYRLDLLRPDLGLDPAFQLPVHNYAHAKNSGIDAFEIAEEAMKHGVTDIEVDVLKPMGCWHDAGFALRPGIEQMFGPREVYSSDVAQKDLRVLGMPEPKVLLVGQGIESTAVGVKCLTNTAKCLRQGDLNNLRGPAIPFLNVTYRLYREQQILDGKPIVPVIINPGRVLREFIQFAGISHEILSTYLEEDISLGDYDRDENGVSLFAKEAVKNVDLLVPSRLTEFLSKNFARVVTYNPIGL